MYAILFIRAEMLLHLSLFQKLIAAHYVLLLDKGINNFFSYKIDKNGTCSLN